MRFSLRNNKKDLSTNSNDVVLLNHLYNVLDELMALDQIEHRFLVRQAGSLTMELMDSVLARERVATERQSLEFELNGQVLEFKSA